MCILNSCLWSFNERLCTGMTCLLTMDKLPAEILSNIASLLSYHDLCNFRLVNRLYALSTYHIITRHLSLLDISSCLTEFIRSHESKFPFTRQLTIYHGQWPYCNRQQWQIHPLLEREIHPQHLRIDGVVYTSVVGSLMDCSYQKYKVFIDTERQRSLVGDARALKGVLSCVPNVRTLTLTHLKSRWRTENPKFSNLRKAIWMSPSHNNSINRIVQTFLEVSHNFEALQELVIDGKFDPAGLTMPRNIENIRKLRVTSPPTILATPHSLPRFLAAFPNLEVFALTLTVANGTNEILRLEDIPFPRLQALHLRNVWLAEKALRRTLDKSRRLRAVGLADITLSSGSWQSFFTTLRNLGRDITVIPDGRFDGLCFYCPAFSVEDDAKYRLQQFLARNDSPWPFRTVQLGSSFMPR